MTNPASDDDWRTRLLDNVADMDERRKDGRRKIVLDPEDRSLILDAARMRGMSEQAYMRRSIMAFVCYDLGLDWDEIMAKEGPVRRAGQAAVYDRRPMRGTGFGRWKIVGVR